MFFISFWSSFFFVLKFSWTNKFRIRIRITLLIPKGKLLFVTTTAPTQSVQVLKTKSTVFYNSNSQSLFVASIITQWSSVLDWKWSCTMLHVTPSDPDLTLCACCAFVCMCLWLFTAAQHRLWNLNWTWNIQTSLDPEGVMIVSSLWPQFRGTVSLHSGCLRPLWPMSRCLCAQ